MPEFIVMWSANISAECHEEAAEIALASHRDPESIGTIFEVKNCDDDVLVVVDPQEKHVLSDERGEDYEYA